MKKESIEIWASIAEIVAAVGVIVSVVYLAAEISEGTLSLKAQTHNDLLNQFNEPFMAMASSDELASVVSRGLNNPDSLSQEEWDRFSMYHLVLWNAWEYGYYLVEAGTTERRVWEGANAWYIQQAKTQPGLARFWKETGIAYAEPFYSYADMFVKENPAYEK